MTCPNCNYKPSKETDKPFHKADMGGYHQMACPQCGHGWSDKGKPRVTPDQVAPPEPPAPADNEE